jgi:hypothetical protein
MLEPQDENKIKELAKEIARKEIESFMVQKQFNLSKIQNHEHNGLDTVRINEKDLINADMYSLGVTSVTSETFYIKGLQNFKHITCYAIASNQYSGTKTKKATITGEVQIGKTYSMGFDSTGTMASPSGLASNFYQTCSSIYVDTTNVANTFVTSSLDSFVRVINSSVGNVVAEAKVTSIENGFITIQTTLEPTDGWYITMFLLIE